MELTVYRQSSKARADGTIVYKGEDARPYVDGQIIFVADGLGGAASIRHQKIKPELFDEDKILDVLFKDVFEKYDDERFVKYVKDSFFELFAVKNCYTDNVNNIKKSGFFASRIVTSILLHEMIYNHKCSAGELFATLASAETEEAKTDILNKCSKHFKELIQSKLRQIAKNANLIYESSYSGLALLGSTLCATIYLENEDSVEAIYLTAGDSRPYVWQESTGLCQVLPDEEGKDGGMTNYIKANDDSDFYIRANYMKFAKPCIIFNASDGCFDSGKFVSQMAFEALLLGSVTESNSMEKVSDALTEFFVDYGRHDDSSTIALKAFGFESYDALKDACDRRFSVLKQDYISKMEDLLDVDYALECEECERKFPARLSTIKEKFSSEAAVIDYCGKYVKAKKYEPARAAIDAIDQEILAVQNSIEQSKVNIADVIAANFIKFWPLVMPKEEKLGWRESVANNWNETKIDRAEEKHTKTANDYIAALQKYRVDFDQAVSTLNDLLEQVSKIDVPADFCDFDQIAFDFVDKCEKDLDSLFEFFKGLKNKKLAIVKRLTEQRKDYIDCNRKFAEKHKDELKMLCAKVLTGQININELDIFSDDKAEISGELVKISEAEAKLAQLEGEAKEQALGNAAEAFWNAEYVQIITDVLAEAATNPEIKIDETLAAEARALLDEYNTTMAGVREKCNTQVALFAKYDETYNQYIGG